MFSKLIHLSFVIFNFSVLASYEEKLIKRALELKLDQKKEWINLLHYQKGISGYKSDIVSSSFFFSEDGSISPRSELIASIKNVKKMRKSCKFIARYGFLKEHLLLKEQNKSSCEKYMKWSKNESVKSLSIVFATGYLGNPASFFGHPLLKLNFENKLDPSNLLDISINYGAITPPKENPFIYAIKGIFGGYDAGFSGLDFFLNNHNYTEVELRDLWELKLDIRKEGVLKIVRHLWELQGEKFSYYFFSNNCASGFSKLLSLVTKEPVLNPKLPYAIPYEFIDKLFERNLVKKVEYIPSRQTRFNQRYLDLNWQERAKVKEFIENRNVLSSRKYKNASETSKKKIIETLVDYYSYREILDKMDLEAKKKRQVLLKERMNLTVGRPSVKRKDPSFIKDWQKNKMLQVGPGKTKGHDEFVILRLRPTYYDLFSIDKQRSESGHIKLMNTEIRASKNKTVIQELEIFNLLSLNLSKTGLPRDGGAAWKVKAGLKRVNDFCDRCSYFGLEAGIGKAYAIGKRLIIFGLVTPTIQSSIQNSGHFGIMGEASIVSRFSSYWRTQLSASYKKLFDRGAYDSLSYGWENRFSNSRVYDVGLKLKYNQALSATIFYSIYF